VNFFQHQDRARRQSRTLIVVFILAVLAIVAAIDALLLVVVGASSMEEGAPLPSPGALLEANLSLLAGGALVTLAVIGVASLFKIAVLRSGGGQVARQLGGVLVEADTQDHQRRQLRNVVEEISLASGVPVPEIYVLEQESGINAFAAGYTPSDAAVAVTRGALENLNRNELQGVIAHEFSHILNGDMRLNIRLMGALFGILLLALIGRRVLIHSHFARSSRDRNGAAVVMVAFGLMAVGYIGLFFGRWIKAAVSRQREYLADASAVQFTRDPDSIGGALKKIAVYSKGSHLDADSEEISHMLFGDGRRMRLFSTHPPLNERIARVDPGFRPEELDALAASIRTERARERARERAAAERRQAAEQAAPGAFDAAGIIEQIGNPDWERLLMAAAVAASLPDSVREAARSTEWAPEVLFYTLLDADSEIRERQLLIIAQRMGGDSEAQVRGLMGAAGLPGPQQRLPLLEMAFTALKRRPPDFVTRMLDTVKALAEADGRTDVFEFLLARSISQQLWESHNPGRVRTAGAHSLDRRRDDALLLMAVLARHGHADAPAARSAFRAGCTALDMEEGAAMPDTTDWVAVLDAVLPKLDRLKPAEKERLVRALTEVVTHDGELVPAELELLRAACTLIHVPLPLLTA
jgi:Zn-dependent protease with chaperone function